MNILEIVPNRIKKLNPDTRYLRRVLNSFYLDIKRLIVFPKNNQHFYITSFLNASLSS